MEQDGVLYRRTGKQAPCPKRREDAAPGVVCLCFLLGNMWSSIQSPKTGPPAELWRRLGAQ